MSDITLLALHHDSVRGSLSQDVALGAAKSKLNVAGQAVRHGFNDFRKVVDDDLTDDLHYTVDAQGTVVEREKGDLIGKYNSTLKVDVEASILLPLLPYMDVEASILLPLLPYMDA